MSRLHLAPREASAYTSPVGEKGPPVGEKGPGPALKHTQLSAVFYSWDSTTADPHTRRWFPSFCVVTFDLDGATTTSTESVSGSSPHGGIYATISRAGPPMAPGESIDDMRCQRRTSHPLLVPHDVL
eukprot:TRINITY_DN4998_c0_g1_i1.p2 TRINITY_DN4998_c0_g1~~TRINITY_DN4998_c0_g1_i1.p2  ORF type:complete len:127 (-),score=2.58 TRINITY_DN4998_c0_g1_i1:164-544(-)